MSTEQIIERPKTGHGDRTRSLAHYQAEQQQYPSYVAERPLTSRANRPKSRLGRESKIHQEQWEQKSQSQVAVITQGPTSDIPIERPRTSKGRRSMPQDSDYPLDYVTHKSASPPQPDSDPYERPGTSRGHRLPDPDPGTWASDHQQQGSYSEFERTDRPKTSHGRREGPLQDDVDDDVYIPFDGSEGRPTTSRGRRSQDLNDWGQDPEASAPFYFQASQSNEVNILKIENDNENTKKNINNKKTTAKSSSERPKSQRSNIRSTYDGLRSAKSRGSSRQNQGKGSGSQVKSSGNRPSNSSRQSNGQPNVPSRRQSNGQPNVPSHRQSDGQPNMPSHRQSDGQPNMPSRNESLQSHSPSPRGPSTPLISPSPTHIYNRPGPGTPLISPSPTSQIYNRPGTAGRRFSLGSTRRPSGELDFNREQLGGSSPVERPESSASLSRYNILPAIGSTSHRSLSHSKSAPASDSAPTIIPTGGVLVETMEEDKNIFRRGSNDSIENFLTSSNTGQGHFVVESLDSGITVDQLSVTDQEKMDASQTSRSDTSARSTGSSENTFKPLSKTITLPPEPTNDESKLFLAVKLPSGNRIQRNFSLSDKLQVVISFAELSAQLDFSGCVLVCDAPPRAVYKDLEVSLKESAIVNRTVLHIQVPDE